MIRFSTWLTPEAGGKVDRERPTQFGRPMRQLGVEMNPRLLPRSAWAMFGVRNLDPEPHLRRGGHERV